MVRFIARRLMVLVATLLAASTITFLLVAAMPGDPIRSVLKVHIMPGQYATMVHLYGLDLPLWQRYVRFMGGLLHGDFGLSLTQPGQRVTDLLAAGIPVSLTLGGLALALALLVGVPVGALAAARRRRFVEDRLIMGVMLLLLAAPTYVLIPPMVDLFSIRLHWLPTGQWGDDGWLGVQEAIMPVLVYAAGLTAFLARSVRSMLLEVLNQDYIRIARAKGLSGRRILFKHALKNVVIPFSSLLGPTIAGLVVGSAFVETQFSINGIANITVKATEAGDLPITEATTLVLTAAVVTMNALTDMLYTVVDPRVQL